ncbi:MAG TPA: hypothetical protein VGL88_05375 [Pseudonocardiaceae bacterium]
MTPLVTLPVTPLMALRVTTVPARQGVRCRVQELPALWLHRQ